MAHSDDTDVARLREQIRGLEEQLQHLVRTEQRLYYARRDVGRQLQRVEALNAFAIEAARGQTEEEILHRAVVTFFSLFAYEQALAFRRDGSGRICKVVSHSVPGREGAPLSPSAEVLALPDEGLPRHALFLSSAQAAPQEPFVGAACRVFEQVFGSADAALLLLLPLRDGAESPPLGFMLLRRQGELAFHETLAIADDETFLELFGRHVATALTQFRLVADLRESYANLAAAQIDAVQRERLAALGELAAVVAHEIRNPVAVIFNSVAGLRRSLPLDAPNGELLAVITEEAQRLDEMVADLLDFARPRIPQLRNEKLESIVRLAVERAVGGRDLQPCDIRIEIEPNAPLTIGDARMLHQAVVNLVTNALQASGPDDGVLVRLGREKRGDAVLTKLQVIDRGPGIAPANLARIFEPFFTTKAKGSGLGLAVVKKVVEAHRGELRVNSNPGEGSTFTLLFPGVEAAAEKATG